MKSLVLDAKIFGVTLFGDGATIKTVPMVKYTGAGVQNDFSMLYIFEFFVPILQWWQEGCIMHC